MNAVSRMNDRPKASPGWLIGSLALMALRGFLHYAVAMRRIGEPSYAISYACTRAIIAPAVISALFCIPKSGRNSARFAKSFAITSTVMLLLDIGEIGQSLKR